jgi:hypothetical protein
MDDHEEGLSTGHPTKLIENIERAIVEVELRLSTYFIAAESVIVRREQRHEAQSVVQMLQQTLHNLRSVRSTLYELEARPCLLAEA